MAFTRDQTVRVKVNRRWQDAMVSQAEIVNGEIEVCYWTVPTTVSPGRLKYTWVPTSQIKES